MKIGSRGFTTRTKAPTQDQANPAAFGAGVGEALQGLAAAFGQRGVTMAQLQSEERNRQRSVSLTRAQIDMERMRGEVERERTDRRVQVTPGARGFTDTTAQTLEQRWADYERNLQANYPELGPEEVDRLRLQWTGVAEGAITSDFAFEIEESVRSTVSDVEELTQAAMIRVREGGEAMGEYTALRSILDSSNLPMLALEEVDDQIRNQLFTIEFEREFLNAARGITPVSDPRQAAAAGDAVAPGLTGTERGLLSTISSVESNYGANSYQVIYGGQTFANFSDHPRVGVPIPNDPRGRVSTAAGRYQFRASTWDFVRENMEAEGYDFGAEVFSPVNQDRAALWYARYRYNQAARLQNFPPEVADFDTVLNSGDPEQIARLRDVFAGSGDNTVWQGLQRLTGEQFAQLVATGAAPGATGTAEQPDIWNDPRFASIPYEDRGALEASLSQQVARERSAAATEAYNAQNTIVADLRAAAAAGAPGLVQRVQALLPQITDGNLRAQAIQLVQSEINAQRDAGEAEHAVRTGTPITADNADTLDAFYRLSGVSAGIQQMDDSAGRALTDTFVRTGQIGPEMLQTLQAMSRHSNPQQRTFALDLLGTMYQDNPRAFGGAVSGESFDSAVLWEQMSRITGSPARALEQFEFLQDPRNRAVRQRLQDEAEEITADISPEEVFSSLYGNLETFWQALPFTENPVLPNERDYGMLLQDYRAAFSYAYTRSGDETVAREHAAESIRNIYSPDPVSGALMYLSPTSAVVQGTTLSGVQDWFTDSMYSQHPMLRNMEGVTLIPTEETLRAVRNGEAPSYAVQYTNAEGMYEIGLDENNQPIRVEAFPTPRVLFDRSVRARIAQASSAQGVIAQTLDSFQRDEMGILLPDFQSTPEMTEANAEYRRLMDDIAIPEVPRTVRPRAQIMADLRNIAGADFTDPAIMHTLGTLTAEWEAQE